MKKYIFTIAMVSLLAACGGNANDTNNDTAASGNTSAEANAGSADISQNPDYQKGLDLIGSSDCLTCHKVNEKLVGPSYQDVANKYAGVDTAVTYLAHRIIHGVNPAAGDKSDWADVTNNAAMTPHPQVSQADAEQMVKYILLLKNQ
ncbi:c-type cytochrome [Ilyomonas limi]|uniref:C-type cytochrome n=1 Tax=Ilyomonas limi TaxID=2575867 RepID=A0A4U3KX34_9BACT|nr:c-type cytochrome [Ilyomonas limi]TKK66409.1 c-type cytochrome [Ilyomonas limi]